MKEKICGLRLVRRICGLRPIRYLSGHPFFGKFLNYETISYLIAGVLTTAVNYLIYFLMPRFGTMGLDILLAEIVSWTAAVAFAFLVNKVFVFLSPSFKRETVLRELIPFVTCRLLSLGMEAAILWIAVVLLRGNEPLWKIIANVFVLAANFFASKFLIFRKEKKLNE